MYTERQNILITGGLGFVGSSLAIRLVQSGARVTILDNLDSNAGGNLHNIFSIQDDVTLLSADIRDFESVVSAVSGQDLIINCAATTSHPHSMREPWETLEVNSKGAINVVEACRQFNRTARLIQIGTSTQLGVQTCSPANELHPEFPLDLYSATKSAAEKFFLIYAHAYELPVSVIRFANIYGPRAAIHSPEFTFNNFFIGQALGGGPITVYGDGLQRRNILFIDDAIDAIISLAKSDKYSGQVFLAGSDQHLSVLEIAETIAETFGCTVVSLPWPIDRRAIEIGDVALDNTKTKKWLGWTPKIDIKQGLTLTKDYYLAHLHHYLR